MTIKAVLFDIDGTLVDSNDFHVEAWGEAFRSVGADFSWQVIHDQIGKGTDMLVPTLLPGTDEAEQERLGDAHGSAFKDKYLDRVVAFPGARDLLLRVHAAGTKVVLASSAAKEELDHYIDLLDVGGIVAETTTADDVEQTKPAPDIFQTALRKARITADDAIVVGDTPYDIEAAAKCGMDAIGLLSGKYTDEALRGAGAIAVYEDVAALLAAFDASPLVK